MAGIPHLDCRSDVDDACKGELVCIEDTAVICFLE